MLRRLLARFKRDSTVDKREEKRRLVKIWINKIGINWCDVENLLFWKDPRVSLAVFILFTGFFWKFITYKLQKIGLVIIVVALTTTIPICRQRIWDYCVKKLQLKVKNENRSLGFDCNDIFDFLTECWLGYEQHHIYLYNLQLTSISKFYLIIVSYITLLIIIFTYVPLASVFYILGTILYFYPIIKYLDVLDTLYQNLERRLQPFLVHWSNSRTKRTRDRTRKPLRYKNQTPQASLSDLENEEFLPVRTVRSEKVSTAEIKYRVPSVYDNEEHDEFRLRGEFHKRATEDHSSDYDEDSFLPTYNYEPSDGMPSLSKFDSLMEPLDEFHKGLDFRNVTATSNYSSFGLPSNYVPENDTDEDVDDISLDVNASNDTFVDELLPTTKGKQQSSSKHNSRPRRNTNDDKNTDDIIDLVEQEFEFLDSSELNDVTDEEINEQNVGEHSHLRNIVPGSNILGY